MFQAQHHEDKGTEKLTAENHEDVVVPETQVAEPPVPKRVNSHRFINLSTTQTLLVFFCKMLHFHCRT